MLEQLPLDRLRPLIGPLILIALWQLAVVLHLVSPILLPAPADTLGQLLADARNGTLGSDILATVMRTLEAFLIATLIGVPTGVVLGASKKVYESVEFLVDFFRSTPSSALIPLFMLLFGLSDLNKVAIAAFAALLVILFSSAYGVMQARKTRVMAARVMGVPSWRIFTDVLLMESLPQIIVGLRSGISMALVIVIVAEMFIGSDDGLGHRIIDAQQVFNIKGMYAAILTTGALGYLFNMGFLFIERRFVHWSGR
jgi:ABC-type nitrate/sulfonate/bicarbonate transport system permease component